MIENKGLLPTHEIRLKAVPPLRLLELSATAADFEPDSIAPVVQPLFGHLRERIELAGLRTGEPMIAYYEPVTDWVVVHAGVPATDETDAFRAAADGLALVKLPAAEVAVLAHQGSMAGADVAWQEIAVWLDTNDYRVDGHARESYIACLGEDHQQVTELQQPVGKPVRR